MIGLYAMKGGVGVSVLAAVIAAHLAGDDAGALLVDLAGEQEALLGLPASDAPGLADWLAAGDESPVTALHRLERPVVDGLVLLPRGAGPMVAGPRMDSLVKALEQNARAVVVDCGSYPAVASSVCADAEARIRVAAACETTWMVARRCYLSVRASAKTPIEADGIVLVSETGRVLSPTDVSVAVGAPIALDVALDLGLSRTVDAGLLPGRVPRSLRRVIGRALFDLSRNR